MRHKKASMAMTTINATFPSHSTGFVLQSYSTLGPLVARFPNSSHLGIFGAVFTGWSGCLACRL